MSSPTESAILNIPPCQSPECHQATDIVLKSSDEVLFGAHISNLEQFTHAFPISGSISLAREIIPFPDMTSTVLNLFLQFTHHQRQPDLSIISFRDLAALAEAVEKYEVYSATEACKANMHLQAADYAPQVLNYALKHNYRQICDIAAKHALKLPTLVITSNNSPASRGWLPYAEHIAYLQSMSRVVPKKVNHPLKSSCPKRQWKAFEAEVLLGLAEKDKTQEHHIISQNMYLLEGCRHCGIRAHLWEDKMEKGRREGVPSFYDFMQVRG